VPIEPGARLDGPGFAILIEERIAVDVDERYRLDSGINACRRPYLTARAEYVTMHGHVSMEVLERYACAIVFRTF
jgi:hypothetical protein